MAPVPVLSVRRHARAHAGSPAAVPRSPLSSPSLRSALSRSFPSSALDADAAGGSARTTNVVPRGNVPNLAATKCRRRRSTRCRTTAFPTALLTTKPARTGASAEQAAGSEVRTCATSLRRPDRAPLRMTSRKSSLRRNRADAGNKPASLPRTSGGQLRAALTAAGGHDAPARARPHPEPEPVLAGTATVIRLEGTLTHGSVSRSLTITDSWAASVCGADSQPVSGVSPTDLAPLYMRENPGTRNPPGVDGRPLEGTHRFELTITRPPVATRRHDSWTDWQHAVYGAMLAAMEVLWQLAVLVSVPLLRFLPSRAAPCHNLCR